MNYLQILVGLVVFGGITNLIILSLVGFKKSQTVTILIDNWRRENNYKTISHSHDYARYSPFCDRYPPMYNVHRLTVMDANGAKHTVWICFSAPRFETKNIQMEVIVV